MIKSAGILPENNRKHHKLHLIASILFLMLFAFPVFPLKFANFIFMLLSAFTLISFFIKPFKVGKTLLLNLVFVIPFITYLIEFLIFSNNSVAHFEFEKKLFFFTAPLIIPIFLKVTGFKNYKVAFLVFALSMMVLTIYSMTALMIKGIPFQATSYENGAFIFRYYFEDISGLHPTYYSIMALLSACFLFYAPHSGKRWLRITFIGLAVMLFIAVMYLAVRIAFVATGVFILIGIIRLKISGLKKMFFGFLAIYVLIAIIISVPSLHQRLSEITSWANNKTVTGSTISQRKTIFDCSLQVFSEHLLTGIGSRNFQNELNSCYNSRVMDTKKVNYNPHNQFLSMGVNYGIFVLLLFFACLFLIFRKILKFPEGIYYCSAIILFFLSESMLERQMGVYLFCLISLLLYNISDSKSKEITSGDTTISQ